MPKATNHSTSDIPYQPAARRPPATQAPKQATERQLSDSAPMKFQAISSGVVCRIQAAESIPTASAIPRARHIVTARTMK